MLGRDRAARRVPIERKSRALQAVEPRRSLLGSPIDDPEVQLFEIGFGVPRDLNAVCHACAKTIEDLARRLRATRRHIDQAAALNPLDGLDAVGSAWYASAFAPPAWLSR